MLQINTWKNIS